MFIPFIVIIPGMIAAVLVGELTEVWADVGATGQRGRARTDEEGHGG